MNELNASYRQFLKRLLGLGQAPGHQKLLILQCFHSAPYKGFLLRLLNLVVLLIYFGSAITLTSIAQLFDPSIKYVDVPPFWAGTFAIALIVGSYATETFRGAFLGVEPGSIEAARALGLSNLQTFIYVRIPEMWRIALPAFGNHMLSLVKDTALISIIGLNELLFVAEQATATTGKPFTMFIVVGIIYLGFSTVITLVVMGLEAYGRHHLRASK